MIYRDIDLKEWSAKHHITLREEKCRWGCNREMLPKPVETNLSWGINYECETCDCSTYIGRPKDQESWGAII